jgi:alpha-tubulin suppressor-like RCC1 family protein
VRPVIAAGGLQLAPPYSQTFVLRSDGTLWATGANTYGQLGLGDTVQRTSLTQVGGDRDWLTVTCGGGHTLALKQDGSLWAWGFNFMGQVGDGTTTNRLLPVRVGAANDWVAAAGGMTHTLAVKSDGSLWAWGSNGSGQLGDGTTAAHPSPLRIGAANDWVGVTCSYSGSAAWNRSGELWTWGDNFSGQVGNNQAPIDCLAPQLLDSATDWSRAFGGGSSMSAFKESGRLCVWGSNTVGQLGLGDTTDRHRPAYLGTATDWTAFAQGAGHSLAVQADWSVWSWGWNLMGQLGQGDAVDRTAPHQVAGVRDVLLVAAGFGHSACASVDGLLVTWGDNSNGQLGLGTTTSVAVPTATTFRIDVTGPSATAKKNVTVKWGKKAKLEYSLTDEFCTQCTAVRIRIKKGARTVKTFNLNTKNCGQMYTKSFTCKLNRGTYKWQVFATDTAGNVQSVQNTKKLIVK